jgi:hypothetical protein
MGNSFHYQGVRLYAAKTRKHNIPFTRIMLHWIGDILDKQVHFIEAKGAWVIVPIFGINCYIMAWFADITAWQGMAELTKNIFLSVIGIAMGCMGVVNTYIGMKKRIKKYKEENNPEKKKSA